ncbi:hypothetical protein HaLaN_24638 [Haematococcus lacustris]|uniref:Uncharacterized protein n=1 Tax=Haematococcus lacustris TaxID=44745 RepID=A0A699ZVI6_HAELA|nr:hypothetical protein HaLaN_24638 [Haematococcus lacustris]
MAGGPRRLDDSAFTWRDAQRLSNSAFPPRAFRRVHDSAQTHHAHSRPATERSPGVEHVPSQTRQLQEQVQLQSQALDRLEAEFLFALTLIADKLGVPVRMTRAAQEPRKTEPAGQPGGDLLARVKHVFAFYALCGGGTDETRLGRAEWRQWLRDAGLVSDAGPPAGLPGAALDGLFRRALLPGEGQGSTMMITIM